ncbi:hypothetical protein C7N43_38465, partial [Sphingobacteriales bacterium UPWRP_1]
MPQIYHYNKRKTIKPYNFMSNFLRTATTVLILLFTAAAFTPAFAQLEVNGSVTAEELAQLLVGEGVVISNVELNCPDGAFG